MDGIDFGFHRNASKLLSGAKLEFEYIIKLSWGKHFGAMTAVGLLNATGSDALMPSSVAAAGYANLST